MPPKRTSSNATNGIRRRSKRRKASGWSLVQGSNCEVKGTNSGFEGSWSVGKVIKRVKGGFLVEYDEFVTEENTKVREAVSATILRPWPPVYETSFKEGDEVEFEWEGKGKF